MDLKQIHTSYLLAYISALCGRTRVKRIREVGRLIPLEFAFKFKSCFKFKNAFWFLLANEIYINYYFLLANFLTSRIFLFNLEMVSALDQVLTWFAHFLFIWVFCLIFVLSMLHTVSAFIKDSNWRVCVWFLMCPWLFMHYNQITTSPAGAKNHDRMAERRKLIVMNTGLIWMFLLLCFLCDCSSCELDLCERVRRGSTKK